MYLAAGSRRRGLVVLAAALSFAAIADSAPTPAPSFAPNHVFVGGYDKTDERATVFEFDEAGAFVRKIPVEDRALENEVYGLAFGPDGRLYCTVAGSNLIVAVAPDLTLTTILDETVTGGWTVGVAFGPEGRLLVGSREDGGKVIEATLDGTVTNSYTADSDQAPSYVTVGANGHVYVSMDSASSANRNAIVELDASLRYLRTAGESEYVRFPANVTFVPAPGAAKAYVVDYSGDTVHEIDAVTLETTDKFGIDGIDGPYGSAIGPDGLLYVAGYGSSNVKAIRLSDRSIVRELTHPDLDDAAGIAFAPFRFGVKAKFARLAGGAASTRTEKAGVLSYSPGSGQAMLRMSDGTAVVGAGIETASADGSVRFVTTQSVRGGASAAGVGAISFSASGAGAAEAFFVPKSVAGQAHFTSAAASEIGAFKSKKRVP